jgi:hypothetical protein
VVLEFLLGGLEQVFAQIDLAAAGIEFLAAFLQPLQDGALGGRGDGLGREVDDLSVRLLLRLSSESLKSPYEGSVPAAS